MIRTEEQKLLDKIRRALAVDGIKLNESLTVETSEGPTPYTDGSGSIAVAGTSQGVFPANSSRNFFLFQNISSADMYLNFGADATLDSNSIKLPPDASVILTSLDAPSGEINVICGTVDSKFVAKEG